MTDTVRPSFLDRRRDAALAELRERQAEHARVADIVLGPNRTGTRRRVTDVIGLLGGHLVEVADGDRVTWTTVVDGKASSWHHLTQEAAVLHLIARRHDPNDNTNHAAAFYAGRVLGLDREKE